MCVLLGIRISWGHKILLGGMGSLKGTPSLLRRDETTGSMVQPGCSFCFSQYVKPTENRPALRKASAVPRGIGSRPPATRQERLLLCSEKPHQPGAVKGHSPGKSLHGRHESLGKGWGKLQDRV